MEFKKQNKNNTSLKLQPTGAKKNVKKEHGYAMCYIRLMLNINKKIKRIV